MANQAGAVANAGAWPDARQSVAIATGVTEVVASLGIMAFAPWTLIVISPLSGALFSSGVNSIRYAATTSSANFTCIKCTEQVALGILQGGMTGLLTAGLPAATAALEKASRAALSSLGGYLTATATETGMRTGADRQKVIVEKLNPTRLMTVALAGGLGNASHEFVRDQMPQFTTDALQIACEAVTGGTASALSGAAITMAENVREGKQIFDDIPEGMARDFASGAIIAAAQQVRITRDIAAAKRDAKNQAATAPSQPDDSNEQPAAKRAAHNPPDANEEALQRRDITDPILRKKLVNRHFKKELKEAKREFHSQGKSLTRETAEAKALLHKKHEETAAIDRGEVTSTLVQACEEAAAPHEILSRTDPHDVVMTRPTVVGLKPQYHHDPSISPVEAAHIAVAGYKHGRLDTQRYLNKHAPKFTFLESQRVGFTGRKITAFLDNSTGKVVICFTGTETFIQHAENIVDRIRNSDGVSRQAERMARRLIQKYKDPIPTFVSHSKGAEPGTGALKHLPNDRISFNGERPASGDNIHNLVTTGDPLRLINNPDITTPVGPGGHAITNFPPLLEGQPWDGL